MTARRLKLGAIADDLTGATDLALTLSREGMSVRQVVGVPAPGTTFDDADAVVVSLKSRTIPAAEAVAQSRVSAEVLLAAGAEQLFFKYCSTFDSTPAGNIGPVAEALLQLTGAPTALACPAFPTNGRTMFKGHLFVGDVLLSESSMKDHPLTPMRDANLVRVLGQQTRLPVRLVDLSKVRAGDAPLRAALDAAAGFTIVDAVDDNDLRAIGRAAAHHRLVTGGSGVALGLPANFGITPSMRPAGIPAPAGREVVLAGSCSTATRRQIEVAIASGFAALQLDPITIANGQQTVAQGVDFALKAGSTPIIYASAAPEIVAQRQAELGGQRAGELVEHYLGAVAQELVKAGFTRLIVAGGETSGAVVNALDIRSLRVGPEIDPGVPWMQAEALGHDIVLALKSGNFGAEDMLLKAWKLLQ